ncbi:MAG: hypothetical protein OXU70_12595 [Gammaproteobacteria bacterium]|nr:hypothetical protein [Gammaproteobacteria bacterium]
MDDGVGEPSEAVVAVFGPRTVPGLDCICEAVFGRCAEFPIDAGMGLHDGQRLGWAVCNVTIILR